METDTSPTQMSKPTEETETVTMSEELEQPPPEKVFVLHEDEEPVSDPLRTLSDTEEEAIYHRLSKPEQRVYREIDMTLQKADVPPQHNGTNLQGSAQHSERAFSHDT